MASQVLECLLSKREEMADVGEDSFKNNIRIIRKIVNFTLALFLTLVTSNSSDTTTLLWAL